MQATLAASARKVIFAYSSVFVLCLPLTMITLVGVADSPKYTPPPPQKNLEE